MNTRHLALILAGSVLSWLPAQAMPEVERLRALVAEQERQIRMLEEENARLKSDAEPRGSRTLQATGTLPVTAQPAPQVQRPGATREHTVASGDTLMKIGRQYGVSVEAIAKANSLDDGAIIRPGQKLKVPGATTTTAAAPAPAPVSNPTPTTSTRNHTVKAGETFYSISRQHGIAVDRLVAENPDAKPAALKVGQKLRIPQTASTNATEPATTAAAPLPEPAPAPAAPRPSARPGARTVIVEGKMAYGAFAAKYGTTTERLNQLNDLDLDARTVLARGSELYVPAQP